MKKRIILKMLVGEWVFLSWFLRMALMICLALGRDDAVEDDWGPFLGDLSLLYSISQ